MARLFDDASSEYLQVLQNPLASIFPVTMAIWFNTDDITLWQTLMGLNDTSLDSDTVTIQARGDAAGDKLEYRLRDTSTITVTTSTGYSANTWHHAIAWSASSTDHNIEIDGGSAGNSTASKTPNNANIDNVSIGYWGRSVGGGYVSGMLAEGAIWNAALSAGERLTLAAGYSPILVRPQSLVAYWPLIRDEDQDRVGGYDMTAFNTPSIAEHPPIIYPSTPYYTVPAAAAAVSNIPEFIHHYQQQQQAG